MTAPPVPGSFVCNVGDMPDRMTWGLYRFARVQPIDLPGRDALPDDRAQRWDKASVHAFGGTYGEYLLNKVGRVFPNLRQAAW